MPRGKVPMNLPIIWRKTSRKHPGLIIGSRFRNDENQNDTSILTEICWAIMSRVGNVSFQKLRIA